MFLTSVLSYGQTFKEYYRSANLKKQEALKIALGNIIKNHTKRTYDNLKTDYQSVYVVPNSVKNNSPQVYDIFCDEEYYYSNSGKWNREHVAPNSWWGGTKNAAYSDLFSVIPSEKNANSRKSNYPPGEIQGDADYDSGRILVGKPKKGLGGSYNKVYEPYDDYKGDFARIFFYVATCYDDIAWGSKSTVTSEIKKETWPTLSPWLYQMLIKWHNNDPVSEMEIRINDAAQKIQKNRNPFIDYPILADYIWGSLQNNTFCLDSVKAHAHIDGTIVIDTTVIDTTVVDTVVIDTTVVDTTRIVPGEIIFADYFESVTEGAYNSTSKSSTPWSDGDEYFLYVDNVYQAGKAVRLGSGKKPGKIISKKIEYSGGSAIVEIEVKGWSSVEGDLVVELGGVRKTVSYSNNIDDGFEKITINFLGINDNPVLEISTSKLRCFIKSVVVKSDGESIVPDPNTIKISNPSIEYTYDGSIPTLLFDNPQGFELSYPDSCFSSNAGEYDLIVPVSYEKDEVKGTLSLPYSYKIKKAELMVVADDFTREVGEDNPEFTYSIFGFVNDEDESVLTSIPSITCLAGNDAVADDYEITVSGGSALNYDLLYTSGTLTVVVPSRIQHTYSSNSANAIIYTLSGLRVKTLSAPGVYIVNGKKVLVR